MSARRREAPCRPLLCKCGAPPPARAALDVVCGRVSRPSAGNLRIAWVAHFKLPGSVTGEVEVQRSAFGTTLSEFDLVHYLCWQDRLAADVACLIVAMSGKQARGSNLRKCARSDPCSNLLPQQLAVRFLRTVGRRHGTSDDRSYTRVAPHVANAVAAILSKQCYAECERISAPRRPSTWSRLAARLGPPSPGRLGHNPQL